MTARINMIGGKHNGRTYRPYRPTNLPKQHSFNWTWAVLIIALVLLVMEMGK